MPADDPAFDAVMRSLITEIREHVAREESVTLPLLGNALSEDSLSALRAKVDKAKAAAPTHPHPLAPDRPPFNKLLGPGPALVDRVRDWLSREAS